MKKQDKITREKIIKTIAKQLNMNVYDIKDFYNTLENIIFDTLHSVNEERDICMKLFEGISLEGKYIPEKTKINNLTGETHFVDSKVKPKFNITRSYCEKLNDK